ncbi:hypothetical protein ACFOOK_23400 [Micromonospora krabiensis]|uniref:hypothetical protein n=1 Tax=Micromonospora krabiensis TaxID=307121 RepID=UPI000B89CA35|nr:hypothetical protein [Micromonospora krabiensis]
MTIERPVADVFRFYRDCQKLATPLGGLGRAALALVGKPPAAEVAATLRRLKQILETGQVTDTEHAVTGKFDRRPRRPATVPG